MINLETESYLRGLVRMASACAEGVGLSGITVETCSREGFEEEFSAAYKVPMEIVRTVPAEGTLLSILTAWLGGSAPEISARDRRLTENLLWYIQRELGEPLELRVLEKEQECLDALSGCDGLGPFFFMEDVLFAVYREGTVCFLMGNDE